jgi:glycosyltransferase involved in cell wall biosynthesis
MSWWLQTPDRLVGWLPGGTRAALKAVRRKRCRAIFSSAPLWTGHLIALVVRRLTGLPWVADFRDPWRGNPFREIPYRMIDRFDQWLERQVVLGADWIVCNTEPARQDFMRRFPMYAAKFVCITNGFDPDEFRNLAPERPGGQETFVLTHAGVFYGLRRPHALFEAVRILRGQGGIGRRICLQLVGDPNYEGRSLREIAAEFDVTEEVFVRGPVSHRRSLELLRGSDAQILVGFGGKGAELQIPGKLFEYVGVGQPILALAPHASAIADVLRDAGVRAEICAPDDSGVIAGAIRRLAESEGEGAEKGANAEAGERLRKFSRREQVGRIAALLNSPAARQ